MVCVCVKRNAFRETRSDTRGHGAVKHATTCATRARMFFRAARVYNTT
jgi:hypothetical protein